MFGGTHEAEGRVSSAEGHNGRLLREQRTNSSVVRCLLAIVLFLVGGIGGMILEKGHADKALNRPMVCDTWPIK